MSPLTIWWERLPSGSLAPHRRNHKVNVNAKSAHFKYKGSPLSPSLPPLLSLSFFLLLTWRSYSYVLLFSFPFIMYKFVQG